MARAKFFVLDLMIRDMMVCIKTAGDESFTPAPLASAFERAGMWPFDSTKIPLEAINKGVEKPAKDMNLPQLKTRLI